MHPRCIFDAWRKSKGTYLIRCPVGTLSSRFVRGRDALQKMLEGVQ